MLVNEVAPADSHRLMQQPLKLQKEYMELATIVVN